MAFRLGLIDSEFSRALHLIRRIRNSFAHEITGCSLESGAHADRVRELVRPFIHLEFFEAFRSGYFKSAKGVAGEFRCVIGILAARIEHLLLDLEPIDTEKSFGLMSKAMKDFKPDDDAPGEVDNARK